MNNKKYPDSWIEFLAMSKKFGSDSMLIQGAGGNTSIKGNHTMWVKASGKWLVDSEDKNIFVQVDLVTGGVVCQENHTLRPSIETALHLVLPHKIVVHLHSVNALSWLVRKNASCQLKQLLKGMPWAWVPYVKPGKELAKNVHARYQHSAAEIYLLQNHGIVIAADKIDRVYLLIGELEKRLEQTIPIISTPANSILADSLRLLGWRLPKYDEVHHLATSESSRNLVATRALFPDQVVFLGEAPLVCLSALDLEKSIANYEVHNGRRPAWTIIKEYGVVVPEEFSAGAEELLRCLARVVARVPSDEKVNYLTAESVNELLDWDAEKYRRSLELKD
jgi:rhamnose utilization protein RhaD (predicted bifunctional aldolase and dehydrogenase)